MLPAAFVRLFSNDETPSILLVAQARSSGNGTVMDNNTPPSRALPSMYDYLNLPLPTGYFPITLKMTLSDSLNRQDSRVVDDSDSSRGGIL